MRTRRSTLSPLVTLVLALAVGCTPKRPRVSVTARLTQPVENHWVESAVRLVPGVEDVHVFSPSPSYTLTGKRIPDRNSFSFRAPGLSGATGNVGQWIDQKDFTTTELTASALWLDPPTKDEKQRAARTLQRLVGRILLSAGEESSNGAD